VREKRPLENIPEVMTAIRGAEHDLAGNGRVNVRYSGTETLARVMVEAESKEKVERHVSAIARALEKTVGA
jgi:phosphoglucosamine mutase